MEQQLILNNYNSFNPKHIFECGQCFRWTLEDDNSYTCVFGKNVLNIKSKDNSIVFTGVCNGNIKNVCNYYFDLDTDYNKIKKSLSSIDNNLKLSTLYGDGIRILNQDLWETIISFIISANNNIPRIKGIIERICKSYGDKILWNNKIFYTFPTPKQLSVTTVSDLRNLGLGFRDVRVYETTKLILENKIDLNKLKTEKSADKIRERLLKLPGVGPKVADCIMLFSLKRYDVFPIDVWVRRVMNELYIHNIDENKINKTDLQKLAIEKYGNLAGLAQQYLFYWRRGA